MTDRTASKAAPAPDDTGDGQRGTPVDSGRPPPAEVVLLVASAALTVAGPVSGWDEAH